MIALTALAALLRFSALAQQSFWYDEAVSVALAKHGAADLLSGRIKDLGNPPLYPLLLHLWMGVFGNSDAAARALSAVFGAATVPIFFALATRLVAPTVALLAATLLALSPFHVQMAQEARGYTFLALLGTGATWALVTAVRAPRRWPPWLLLAACTAAMTLTHYFAFLLVLAHAAYLIVAHRRERIVLARAAVAYGLAALAFSFWLPAFFEQLGSVGNLTRSPESYLLHLGGTPLVFALGTALVWKDAASWPRLLVGIIGMLAATWVVGLGVARVWRRYKAGQREALVLVLWLVVPVVVPGFISLIANPLYNTRYVIQASLPFLLFAAAGLLELTGRARAAVASIMAIAMAGSAFSYFSAFGLGRPVKHQWREAAAFVERWKAPGDLLVFDADYNETAYAHYAGPGGNRIRVLEPEEVVKEGNLHGARHAGDEITIVSDDIKSYERVWLILSDARPEPINRMRRFFARWKRGPATHVRGISIQRFDRPADLR